MKNNFLIILLIAALYCGCKTQKLISERESDDQFVSKTILSERDYMLYGMPKGTNIGVFSQEHTTTNTEISILVPISGNSEFNEVVTDTLLKLKNKFLESATKAELPSYFEISPEAIYETKKVISLRFRVYEAYSGAAHGGSYYFSCNWDAQRQKWITFDDYFNALSEKDEKALVDLINESFDKEDGNIGNLRNTDFNIEADTVSFNPGEVGSYVEGLYTARIAKNKLEKYIQYNYR